MIVDLFKGQPTERARLEFLSVPGALHGEEPWFVAPLRASEERILDRTGAFAQYGEVQPLLARPSGSEPPQGRACAFVNPRLCAEDSSPIGQIGLLSLPEDPAVAEALFEAARAWLAQRGAREVVAPMDGGAHAHHRVMTAGWDRSPFLFEPRNPAYLPALLARQQLAPIHAWDSFEVDCATLARLAGELRAEGGDRAETAGFRIEPLDPGDLVTSLGRLHTLLDDVWQGHTGYASLSLEEVIEGYAGLLALMGKGQLVAMKDPAGVDVGFAFAYPDDIAQVRAIEGDAARWASWCGTGRVQPERIVLHTVAVTPRARRTGVAQLAQAMVMETAIADGYQQAVIALVDQDFRWYRKRLEPTRTYALYGGRVEI
jgi:hypothetical protein